MSMRMQWCGLETGCLGSDRDVGSIYRSTARARIVSANIGRTTCQRSWLHVSVPDCSCIVGVRPSTHRAPATRHHTTALAPSTASQPLLPRATAATTELLCGHRSVRNWISTFINRKIGNSIIASSCGPKSRVSANDSKEVPTPLFASCATATSAHLVRAS